MGLNTDCWDSFAIRLLVRVLEACCRGSNLRPRPATLEVIMSADVKQAVNEVEHDALTVPIAPYGDRCFIGLTTKTPGLFVPFLELLLFSILNFAWWQELLGLVFSIRRPRWPFWAKLIVYRWVLNSCDTSRRYWTAWLRLSTWRFVFLPSGSGPCRRFDWPIISDARPH